jgi:hypothetical protein
MKNMKNMKNFESFRETHFGKALLTKPRNIKMGTKVKYKDEDGEYRYGIYIRDTIFRGEFSAASLFSSTISIIKDDELGRIKIKKDKLEIA